MNRLVIIGAGGHGKVIADIAMKCGYTDICFLDDHAVGMCMGFPIAGTSAELTLMNDGATDFVIAVGTNATRRKIAERFHVSWVTLIHPSAWIAADVTIGQGTVVMAGAMINPSARVGAHCIINTGSIVEHDNVLGDYVHLSPRTTLSGTVAVGECAWLGTGTSVINNVEICSNATVGAGSVVIRSIRKEGTYYGIIADR